MSDLFLAGIVPGLMIGLLLMCYSVFYCKRHGEDKVKIHAAVEKLHRDIREACQGVYDAIEQNVSPALFEAYLN